MNITFFPSVKHYGKQAMTMSNIDMDITSARQLVNCIHDGYVPVMSWSDTKSFLYEMMYQAVDSGLYSYSACVGIIDAIGNRYFAIADFMESDAIIVFHRFLKTGILEF